MRDGNRAQFRPALRRPATRRQEHGLASDRRWFLAVRRAIGGPDSRGNTRGASGPSRNASADQANKSVPRRLEHDARDAHQLPL